jgi:hypothetical protein
MKTYSYVPCSDITSRDIKWVNPCQDNGSFPSSYIHWGVSAVSIAAQYAEVHAHEVKRCPVSGWVSGSTLLDPMIMQDSATVSAVRRARGIQQRG